MSTPSGLATSSERSGTAVQPGSSSYGSEATTTPSASARQHSVSPQVVAAIARPSVSSRLSRPPAVDAASRTVLPSASAIRSPACSRWCTTSQSSAESDTASIAISSAGASCVVSRAIEVGHPVTAPLWLNR